MKEHLLQTLPVWWFYLSSLFLIGLVAWFIHKWQETEGFLKAALRHVDFWKEEWSLEKDRAEQAQERVAKADTVSTEVVMTVAPLLEKTDWMTGRWGGQFGKLVQLENERNRKVEEVMRKVSSLPAVEDLPKVAILDGAQQEALGRLENEVGVPEDQRLEFAAEGGVERVYKHVRPLDWPS